MTGPTDQQYMGLAEVAEYRGVTKQTASNWRKRGKLPVPTKELAMGPVWDTNLIIAHFGGDPKTTNTCEHSASKNATHCVEYDIETLMAMGIEYPGFSFIDNLIPMTRPVVFSYCSYWGTWNRLLKPRYNSRNPNEPEGYVEFSISPINGWDWPGAAQSVYGIIIRKHGTSPTKPMYQNGKPVRGDYETHLCPDHVRQALIKRCGEAKATFMLTHDFMADIDWELYKSNAPSSGGGTPFLLCRIDSNAS